MPWGEKNHGTYEKKTITQAIISKIIYMSLFWNKKNEVEHILNLAPVLWNMVKINENQQKLICLKTSKDQR